MESLADPASSNELLVVLPGRRLRGVSHLLGLATLPRAASA